MRAAPGSYIAANGSALSYAGQVWYWYETGMKDRLRISLARSADARTWRAEAAPVLDLGPVGSWDERAVADPYVIRIGQYFYMYYLGQDRAVRQRIGVARSSDGIRWEKLRANPVVEMDEDEAGIGEPAVWQSHGFYWMLYTVRDFAENRASAPGTFDGWGALDEARAALQRYPSVELQSDLRRHRSRGRRCGEGLVRRRRRGVAG